MGFVAGILDFLRQTLGLARPEPVPSLGDAASAPVADDDDDEDDGAEPRAGGDGDPTRDGQLNIEEEWAEMQAFVQRCETERLDLAGLDVADPEAFWARQGRIEQAHASGMNPQQAVLAAGFRSVHHWDLVSRYFQAKWSDLVHHASGEREIRPRDAFTAAAGRARGSWTPQVDARLLEPVHGVSLEQWARAAAIVARQPADAGDLDRALAPVGLTHARFTAADGVWRERMREDATRTIAARRDAAASDDPT